MATTVHPSTRRYTVADLERFPPDEHRYEVIDGELYVSYAPGLLHQAALQRLTVALHLWQEAEPGRGFAVAGPDVVLDFDTGVIPDLVWIAQARLTAAITDPATGRPGDLFSQAPDLLVEVLSPGAENQRRDRAVKLALYARHGAAEYWLIDYQQRTVEVFRRASDDLRPASTLMLGEDLTSPLLPNFRLPLARLFTVPAALADLPTDA